MACPQCNAEKVIKNGNAKQKQRYLCKSCNYQFTIGKAKHKTDPKISFKRRALHLMLEGVSIRKIADILSVAPTTIANWKKEWSKIPSFQKFEKPEIYNYADSLKYITAKQHSENYTFLILDLETDISFMCKD